MAIFTDLLPPTKSDPHGAGIDWTPPAPDGPKAGRLVIKSKRRYTTYAVAAVDAVASGRTFVLTKHSYRGTAEDRYVCQIGASGAKRCECKGYHHNGSCKHLAALVALIQAGQL